MYKSNTLSNLIIFAVGAAVGSFATWKFVEGKYRRIADEEIEAVRSYYREREGACTTREETEPIVTSEEKQAYEDIAARNGYVEKPYVIEPGEFDTLDGYDIVSLTYYSDGILTDDMDEIVDDADDIIGIDPADHFGEYEDDAVYVRNDARKCDYEILRDMRTYNEAIKYRPHQAEVE